MARGFSGGSRGGLGLVAAQAGVRGAAVVVAVALREVAGPSRRAR